MPVPEYLVRRFGGYDRVPSYIRMFFERRDQRKIDAERRERERRRREHERVKDLRRPVARVWRIGLNLLWEPPETLGELRPLGYWISEYRNGEWTLHGDYLPEPARESQLYGSGPARVEVVYNQQALGEVYYSPIVEMTPGEEVILGRVRYYCAEKRIVSPVGYLRWCRVLAGFGVVEKKVGWAGRPPVGPLGSPMTAAEAQGYSDRGWSRWTPVAATLRRLEGERRG